MQTHEQKMAEAAFGCVEKRKKEDKFDDYCSFSSSFPTLIHTCGLAQALSFAKAKDKDNYIEDLKVVLEAENIVERSRKAEIMEYIHISRRAISAASWIKRYAQAYRKPGRENNAKLS